MHAADNFESLKAEFMQQAELEKEFPKEVLEEANKFSKEIFTKDKSRENFCHLHIICIDPLGARDHDDAISVEETSNGYILGVHIADVSHFVKPGSALDTEAKKRGYTQYLPWTAVPMLPDILSGDLCSLQENETRFSFSCIITLDKKGKMLKHRFAKGIIKVSRSITYEQAKELHDKKDKEICLLARVAAHLKKLRVENGMLEMDSTEYKCEFSKKGVPQCIVPRQTGISNSWVEECMLAANKCCAVELQKRKLNGVYRIHEAPDPADLTELMQNEPSLFFDSPIDPHKLLKHYTGNNSQERQIFDLYSHLVKKAKNNPILINRILRSMQKACYSDKCTGHFALHWNDYAHFTSPIRRYADLWCHRELNGKRGKINDLCTIINESEIKNQRTERKALKFCASYLLKNEIGQTFKAEIQGIEEFGIFISISTPTLAQADGLVHLRDVPGDFYVYDSAKKTLLGKRTGKRFKKGDKVTVKLIKVNPIKGENDFEIVKSSSSGSVSPWEKREKHEKHEKHRKHERKSRRFGR
ncbi:MAG: RNB domain-containing ribonuclease [Fibromonadales bacterium]|nr:RNB domain-containing ribonuclease [Fibromonadales bacterium]